MIESEYKKEIMRFVKKFSMTIPSDEQILLKNFEKYLFSTIKEIEDSDNKYIKKDKESVIMYLSDIAERLIEIDLESKKQELLKDKNFEKIMNISVGVFHKAKKVVMNGNIEVEETEITEKNLINLLGDVKPHNIEKARELVSETILDIRFIKNPNTNVLSLRIGRFMKKAKSIEENSK